jgi:TP901 family phage tail tape measure protein
MPLPIAGVQLEAQGSVAYFGALDRGVQEMGKFGAAAKSAVSAVNSFGDASTKTGKELDHFEKDTEQAGKASSKFGEVVTGALRQVGAAVVNFALDAGRAFVSFIGDSITQVGNYESSMNMFQAVTGASADEMARAGTLAKDLGADLSLPATSAASAGDAMTALAQAGLSVNDAMAAAKGTLQLAAAGNISEAEAAQLAAAALNQFHLQGSEAIRVADLLAASVAASGSSVEQTGQAVQQAGASFAAAHVPIEDFVTLINEMSKAGIKGSDAGTSLKTMLMRLQAPTKDAAAEMQALGIHIYDAQGAMLPMREIIGQFTHALSGLTQQQRDQAVVAIFGADAQRAANIVLAAGVEAYDKMHAAVTRQNAAAELAAARMKGLNGAVEGLKSQLETLALEGLEPLLPLMTGAVTAAASFASSMSGKVSPAIKMAIDLLTTAAGIIQHYGIPALSGLTTATLLYATVQATRMIPTLIASIPAILAQIAAFNAAAIATMTAVAPYLLVAAAVAGVALAYQDFQAKNASATQQLLNSQSFWQASTAAIEDYGKATGETQTKLAPLAATIAALRQQIEGEIESLGKRMEAGLVSEEQYQAEMATINAHAGALQQATAAYNEQEAALIRQQAASITATAAQQTVVTGEQAIATQTQLTADELANLAKQIQKTFEDGATAVGGYVDKEVAFLSDLETNRAAHQGRMVALETEYEGAVTGEQRAAIGERMRQEQISYTDQEKAAAVAYAQQQAAQSAHLGQMLSDYTVAQIQLGNITKEKGDIILAAIEERFGTTADISSRTFLEMASDIDKFAASGSTDLGALSGKLGATADDAVETRQAMEALAKKYTAELVQNFNEGKISAKELQEELRKIPTRVYTEVVIHTTRTGATGDTGTANTGSAYSGKAAGGPVTAGVPIIVGERRPEVFVPSTSGQIVPSLAQFDRQYRPPMGRSERGASTNVSSYQGPSYAWTIVNPQPQAVDSLASLVKVQQMLYG